MIQELNVKTLEDYILDVGKDVKELFLGLFYQNTINGLSIYTVKDLLKCNKILIDENYALYPD